MIEEGGNAATFAALPSTALDAVCVLDRRSFTTRRAVRTASPARIGGCIVSLATPISAFGAHSCWWR